MKRARAVLIVVPSTLALAACGGSSSVAQSVVGPVVQAELTVAATNLSSWYTAHGTYAGANPGVAGVTLVRADGVSWCVQTASAHENGPGGSVLAGPC
jgi:hypothetical protein